VVRDKEGRVALAWGVYGAPETYLINPEGIIATKRVGSMTPAIWEKQFLPLMEQRK
jgi:cytochrome c biogenesis protein CcmG/thiol:disulfide interchange protein DsbE